MDIEIKKILEDIYSIDPSLKKQEDELIKIIRELKKAKPDTKFDAGFARKLRKELLMEKNSPKIRNPRSSWGLTPAFGAIFVVLLAITFATYYQPGGVNTIKNLGNNAFGSLSQIDSQSDKSARPQSGGGGEMGFGGGGGMSTGMSESSDMMMPEYSQYRYIYQGEEVVDLPAFGNVIRQSGSIGDASILRTLKSLNLDIADINSFTNLKVRGLDLVEDKEEGYSVYIDFKQGIINMYADWEHWTVLREGDYQTFAPQNVPEDNVLIGIADSFIKKHNIDISGYGSPEVDEQFSIMLERAVSSTIAPGEMYFPDTVVVRYPLLIDGRPVYEMYGGTYGLDVSINLRINKVTSVNNIMARSFSTSTYDLETDFNRITKVAGLDAGGYIDERYGNIKDIHFGEPEQVLVHYWRYTDNKSEEFFVPALRFAILDWPEGQYQYRTHITIPLAKDIIDEIDSRYRDYGGGVEPKPLPEPMPVDTAEDTVVVTEPESTTPEQ